MLAHRFQVNDTVRLNRTLGSPSLGRVAARQDDALIYTVTFTTGHTANFPEEALTFWDKTKDDDPTAVVRETPANPGYQAAERFRELVEAQKEHKRYRDVGNSVAALLNTKEVRLVYGKVIVQNRNNSGRSQIITREGEIWEVEIDNLVAV